MKLYRLLGLMSGSSLDGVDLAFCEFRRGAHNEIEWRLLAAETLPIDSNWAVRLRQLPEQDAKALAEAHSAFGHWLGECAQAFLREHGIPTDQVDAVASHGHTLFHEPRQGYSFQLGSGAALASTCGLRTLCDFRSTDVASGGQGAPLAPMADLLLFPSFDFFLNIGGIVNISARAAERMVAFDITGGNQPLNALAQLAKLPYDAGGQLARPGQLIDPLLQQLNGLPFMEQPYPKSLSNQWVQDNITLRVLKADGSVSDRLHTVCRHIAAQVQKALVAIFRREKKRSEKGEMMLSGGGAFNDFLVECIRAEVQKVAEIDVVVPADDMVHFKEAILMALLGMLRLEGLPNVLHTVTGADRDTSGGAVYLP